MSKKRILISHPYVGSRGGGNAVAAWALQALCGDFEVTLATLRPLDYEAVNHSFGTSLREGRFRVSVAPCWYRTALGCMLTPGALLESCMMMRWAQDLDRRERFDILLSTHNEVDFGRRAIQYVHFPWVYLKAAIRVYRNLGFQRVRRVNGYYEDGASAWRMRKSG